MKADHFPNEKHIIVKEVEGYGATGFALLTDREEFLQAIRKQQTRIYDIEDYVEAAPERRRLVMKQLEKPEYSVDTFVHNGQMVIAVPRNRSGVSSGLVIEGSVVKQEELIAISKEIVELFVDDGFINLQFMKEDGQFKLTDVNPRFCGSQIMSLGAGVNFPELFLKYTLTDSRPIPEPIWNTRMYRYRDSYFYHEPSEKANADINKGAEVFPLKNM
ncbi:ATP-grasp domain-containing protein [Alkalibacterium iburiense]|uniref:ATP-grasp domain-containing protein n=1 Tax=Alkalibacterium iburiense TaxID=290589 RepID=UPI0031D50CE9